MLVQSNPLQWPMEMQEQHEEVNKQTDQISCFPTAEASKAKPNCKASTEMAASTNHDGDNMTNPSLKGAEKPTTAEKAAGEKRPMAKGPRKRPGMGLREEIAAGDEISRSVKRQRRDLPLGSDGDFSRVTDSALGGLSTDVTGHRRGITSELGRQILPGSQRSPALLSRLDSEVLPLHLQYQAQESLGRNVARNAAMFASLSGQTHNAHLDPLLLASSRLAHGGSHAWQIRNRFPPSQGLFAQGAISNFVSPKWKRELRCYALLFGNLRGNWKMGNNKSLFQPI